MNKPRIIDEQTQKHIDRFLEGKDAWNEWAEDMLAKRAASEAEKPWKLEEGYDTSGRKRMMSDEPYRQEIQAWLDEAYVDFSNLCFQCEINKEQSQESEEELSRKQTTLTPVLITDSFVDFAAFIFPAETSFANSQFKDWTNFGEAQFEDRADLRATQFKNTAYFKGVLFEGKTEFTEALFEGLADFTEAKFKKETFFLDTLFQSSAFFSNASFQKNTLFAQTDFIRYAAFTNATFSEQAFFNGIKTEKAFNLNVSIFKHQVPDFTQSNFAEAPRLDNIKIVPYQPLKLPGSRTRTIARLMHKAKAPTNRRRTLIRDHFRIEKNLHRWKFIKDRFLNKRRDEEEEARFRALKRLAIQAHDHENEINFFADEIRARRHTKDFPLPSLENWATSARYWAGVLYELTSDFGRSLLRPIGCWLFFFCVFTAFYYASANPKALELCRTPHTSTSTQLNSTPSLITPSQITPYLAARTITAKNSLLFISTDRTEKLKRAYTCLYGASPLYHKNYYDLKEITRETVAQSNDPTKLTSPKPAEQELARQRLAPNVPGLVSFGGIINSLISLALTFLLLLAVRNQFKIK